MTKIEVGKEYNHRTYPMGSNAGYRKVVYVGKKVVLYEDWAGKEFTVLLDIVTDIWEEKKVKHKQVVYANLYRTGNGVITPGAYNKNKSDVCDAVGIPRFVGVGTITLEWEE